jgi:tRNA pseudouridine32 synthase/23S rRNA pseudouridine746 synthase
MTPETGWRIEKNSRSILDDRSGMRQWSIQKTVSSSENVQACHFLALQTGLPKARIKDALNKGACWLSRKGQGRFRLRKATFLLRKDDVLELHYDPTVLSWVPPSASCLEDHRHYSLWFKPANLLTQGTDFGDHGSLLRQAETFFNPRREAFPVHRLDREASGLVLVAHSRQAAGRLSQLFQNRQIIKRYRVEVLGVPDKKVDAISIPLDGKKALTRYRVVSNHPETGTADLLIEIEPGRRHQIRRHLAAIGHPVMGDPRYGSGNKDGRPMRLVACELQWPCPYTGRLPHRHL